MREHIKRATTLSLAGVVSALMLTSPRPILVWNMSASAPVGLYALHTHNHLRHGDLIAILPTESQADFLNQRGFLDKGALLLKHVAALMGQLACRQDNHILIDGRIVATAQRYDHLGRDLPQWRGCRRLTSSEIFLLNAAPDSLDSRYFGPFHTPSVIGRATPLWTDDDRNLHQF
jgi:conjugative transfer signal peptidase TraF